MRSNDHRQQHGKFEIDLKKIKKFTMRIVNHRKRLPYQAPVNDILEQSPRRLDLTEANCFEQRLYQMTSTYSNLPFQPIFFFFYDSICSFPYMYRKTFQNSGNKDLMIYLSLLWEIHRLGNCPAYADFSYSHPSQQLIYWLIDQDHFAVVYVLLDNVKVQTTGGA